MNITLTVPNDDVAGLSAAWADRVRVNDDESAAEHVQRAYAESLANELVVVGSQALEQAVEDATNDEERKTALLAQYKARTGTR